MNMSYLHFKPAGGTEGFTLRYAILIEKGCEQK